jgi:hypothetical protein
MRNTELKALLTRLERILGSETRRRTRETGSNLMFLSDWLKGSHEGVEVLDRGVNDRNLDDRLSDIYSAEINLKFGSTVISIKLSPTSYKVEFPKTYPGIAKYLDTSNQTNISLKNQDGVLYNIQENGFISPHGYLFETISQEDISKVLLILDTAIREATHARRYSLDFNDPAMINKFAGPKGR